MIASTVTCPAASSLLQEHFHQILPEADVEATNAMYTEAAEEQLLSKNPDFVLDAIDNIETKVALLAACHRRGIPVLSSAGAGAPASQSSFQPFSPKLQALGMLWTYPCRQFANRHMIAYL